MYDPTSFIANKLLNGILSAALDRDKTTRELNIALRNARDSVQQTHPDLYECLVLKVNGEAIATEVENLLRPQQQYDTQRLSEQFARHVEQPLASDMPDKIQYFFSCLESEISQQPSLEPVLQNKKQQNQDAKLDELLNKFNIDNDRLDQLSQELGVTQSALRNFFTIIEHEQAQVPADALDATLRQIADNYKKLMLQADTLHAADPKVSALQEQAKAHLAQLEFAAAENLLAEAVALDIAAEKAIEENLHQRRVSAANSLYTLGQSKLTQLQYRDALLYCEQALEKLPDNHAQLGDFLNKCGYIADDLGEYDKAIGYFEKALASDLKTYGEDHPDVAIDWNNLGGAWESIGEYDKAISYYEKALTFFMQTFGEVHPYVAGSWNNLGEAWRAKGVYGKAIGYFEKALASDLNTFGEDHPDVAIDWNNLGTAWKAKGEYDKASEYYEKALIIFETKLGSDHPYTITVRENLASLKQ